MAKKEDNLLKGNPKTQFKKNDQRAVECGKLSGEARRAKKTMRELAQMIAKADITDKKAKDSLKKLGIDDDDLTNNALVVSGVFKSAVAGDMKAVEKWEQYVDADNQSNKLYELPARVIGESFVKINRQIVPNKTYVFEGGRGSTKSSFISLKIVELIKNNPNMHACIVRAVGNTLRDSVYAQMKWAINELHLTEEFEFTVAPLEIKYKKTGQRIFFRGCDDEIKLKSIKPEFGYIGILWKEEKDQLKGADQERSVNQSVLRGGDISYDFSSYNPPKSMSNWVNKEKQVPDANRVIHKSTYLTVDDEWLGQKFLNDAEHLKEVNPDAYDHEYLGESNGTGGQVFEYLDIRTITDEEYNRFDVIYQGVDWGFYPDHFAFVRLAYDIAQETIYMMNELYVNKWSNEQTANWIKENKFNDYPITCDSAEPKSINDYKTYGLRASGAIKGAGSIEYGMKFLQIRKIVIDPARTPNIYNEFANYEFERDKEGNVISGYPDANNHLIDATRYALEKYCNKRYSHA